MKVSENLLELVGNTPLVELTNTATGISSQLFAKLEYANPTGSVKDRVSEYIIDDAQKKCLLKPCGTIVEATSGNMGVAFAMIGAVRGYKCIFTMPDSITKEKIQAIKLYGAQVVLTPRGLPPSDEKSCYKVAHKIAEEKGAFYVNQYFNPLNPEAHYRSTGPEIWRNTGGSVDTVICGIGTGGTISGVGRYLKEKNPDIKIIGVEPVGSVFRDYLHTHELAEASDFDIEGIGKNFIPGALNFNYIDEVIQVEEDESMKAVEKLLKTEGILVGPSSGAALSGALKYSNSLEEPEKIVIVFPDTGLKYLSKYTGLG